MLPRDDYSKWIVGGRLPGNGIVTIKAIAQMSDGEGGFVNVVIYMFLRVKGVDRYRIKIDDGPMSPDGCCGAEEFSEGMGNGFAFCGGVRAGIDFGLLPDGRSAGRILLEADNARPDIANRSILEFGSLSNGVTQVRDGTGMRQVATPGMLADFVDLDVQNANKGYEIRYYGAGDFEMGSGGTFTLVGDPDPLITWVIENPDEGSPGDELILTKYLGDRSTGTKQISYEYTYTEVSTNPMNWTWDLVTRDGANTIVRNETGDWLKETSGWTRTYTATDGTNEVALVTETWDGTTAPGRVLSRAVSTGNGTATLNTTYEYLTSAGEQRVLEKRPDGSWTFYRDGYPSADAFTEIEPWGNTAAPTSLSNPPTETSSGVKATSTTWSTGTDGSAFLPTSIEMYADGSLLSETTYDFSDSGNDLTVEEDRNGVTTVSVLDLSKHDRIRSVAHPDGTLDIYAYNDYGDLTGGTTNPEFDPDGENEFTRVTIRHGTGTIPSSPTYIDGKSTADVVVRNLTGRPVLEELGLVDEYGDFGLDRRLRWTLHQRDARGRVTNTYGSNGTRVEVDYDEDACCGTRTETDETGIVTEIVTDALGRVTSRTRKGVSGGTPPLDEDVTTTTDYYFEVDQQTSAVVRVEETEIVGSGMPNTFRRFDLSGRLVRETDAAGLVTTYEYSTSGSPVLVTQDEPTGETRETQYLRDGRVASVTGSAVVHQHYAYTVEGAGSTSVKVATGEDIDSPRYVKTFYDGLGRVTSEVRPAHVSGTVTTQYTYHGTTGRLTSMSMTGMADTLYVYDELGDVLRTGLDVDDDGTLDLGGPDRVSESETTYESISDQWWRETVSRVYAEESGSTPTIISKARARLTGYSYSGSGNVTAVTQVEDGRANVTSATTTTDRADKTVTVETDHPDSSNHSETETLNGLLQSSTDAGGVTTTFGYDALGRRVTVMDGRGNVTTTAYDSAGRVESVEDDEGNETTYAYYASGANAGRLKSVSNAAGKKTYYDYTPRGEIAHVWGDVPQPVRYEYHDVYGDRTHLHTYRAEPGAGAWSDEEWPVDDLTTPGDVTQWAFEESTGLLTMKTYADASEVGYSYTAANRLYQREWARGVVTTYSYDAATGELTQVEYINDPTNTPTVSYDYNRAGRLACVTDATGERDFVYDAETLELNWEQLPDGFFGERDVVRGYGGPVGRLTALGLDTDADGTIDSAEYAADYSYDSSTGRMSRVAGPGLLSGSGSSGVFYSYLTGSNLVDKIEHRNSGGTNVARTTRAFEPNRDLIASVTNDWLIGGTTTVSKYTYYNDSRARRDGVVREGTAFTDGGGASPAHYDDWGYNDRNELTGQTRYNQPTSQPTTQASDGQSYAYDYDPIGNRIDYEFSQGGEPSELSYAANGLNQYDAVRFVDGNAIGQRLYYDEDGNLTHAKVSADMNCDGSVNPFDINRFNEALTLGCADYDATYEPCDCLQGDMNGDGSVNPFDITPFVAALDGGSAGQESLPMVRFVWDGENRLREVVPLGETPAAGAVKWVYTYDYLGRRVAKQKFARNTGNTAWKSSPEIDLRFVYDGWNVMEELNADANADGTAGDFAVIRKYTWGLDLSGQQYADKTGAGLRGAAGVGGILAMRDVHESMDYYYFSDGIGNVCQLIDRDAGSVNARYEYDPYGLAVTASGSCSDGNAYRHSTKQYDAETGLYYFGMRFYSSRLGRWISRDPIGRAGGDSLYQYVANRPPCAIDPLGLCDVCTTWGDTKCRTQGPVYSFVDPGGIEDLKDFVDTLGKCELVFDVATGNWVGVCYGGATDGIEEGYIDSICNTTTARCGGYLWINVERRICNKLKKCFPCTWKLTWGDWERTGWQQCSGWIGGKPSAQQIKDCRAAVAGPFCQ